MILTAGALLSWFRLSLDGCVSTEVFEFGVCFGTGVETVSVPQSRRVEVSLLREELSGVTLWKRNKQDLMFSIFCTTKGTFNDSLYCHPPVLCLCGTAATNHCVVVLRIQSSGARLAIRYRFSLWSLGVVGLHISCPVFYFRKGGDLKGP